MIRLSFDDGPGPSTPHLLDVLRDAGCKATFFVLGQHLQAGGDSVLRMLDEGHGVGNHTYSHARPGALSDAALEDEIATTDALIRDAWRQTGRPVPERIPLRLPYGVAVDDPRVRVLARLGREHVGWTALFDDWQRPAPTPDRLARQMLAHVTSQVDRGEDALLCLHDASRHGESRSATVEATRQLLGMPAYRALVASLA